MRIIYIILFIIPLLSFSKGGIKSYNDTLDNKFKLDVSKVSEHIYSRIYDKYKQTEKDKRKSYRFSNQSAYYISELVSSGKVYSDYDSLENYVNLIFHKVKPDYIKNDTMVHAYIIKDGNFNAFMTPSGMTFINIGVFSYINDESTLAGILAHEMAHYYLQHSLQRFIKEVNREFKDGLLFRNNKRNIFNVKKEIEADSLAMIWIEQSGYNVSGLKKGFEIISRLEKNANSKSKRVFDLKTRTHPLGKERLKSLDKFCTKYSTNKGVV